MKACEGNISKWPEKVHHVFFAGKFTPRHATGFSPHYLIHGVNPVLPFDPTEVTFQLQGVTQRISSEDLLALRIQQLEKRPDDISQAAETIKVSRLQSRLYFKGCFKGRLSKKIFNPGDTVLVRNSGGEKGLDRKAKERYSGPYIVFRQIAGASYVLMEQDGTVHRRGVVAFMLVPYISRKDL